MRVEPPDPTGIATLDRAAYWFTCEGDRTVGDMLHVVLALLGEDNRAGLKKLAEAAKKIGETAPRGRRSTEESQVAETMLEFLAEGPASGLARALKYATSWFPSLRLKKPPANAASAIKRRCRAMSNHESVVRAIFRLCGATRVQADALFAKRRKAKSRRRTS